MRIVKFIFFAAIFLSISACEHAPILKPPSDNPAKLYVANSGDGTVSVINTAQNEIMKTINIGVSPSTIAVSDERRSVYVASYASKQIVVIDAETDVIKNTIVLPGSPLHLVAGSNNMAYVNIDPDLTMGSDAYVGGIKLDQNFFVDSLYFDGRFCNSLQYLAYSRSGILYGVSQIWPTCDYFRPPQPFTVDTKTGNRISVTTFSSRIIKLSPDQRILHIVGEDFLGEANERLFAFDTEQRKMVKDTAIKTILAEITLSPDGERAYVGSAVENKILIYNLSSYSLEDSIMVPSTVADLSVSADNQFIYISHSRTNKVTAVDLRTKIIEKEITVGEKPNALALFPPPF